METSGIMGIERNPKRKKAGAAMNVALTIQEKMEVTWTVIVDFE